MTNEDKYKVWRYQPSLSSRDTTTGWRGMEWDSGEEIEMIIFPRGASGFYTPAGWYGRVDALGWAADPVAEFDHIVHGSDRYEVKYFHKIADGDNFVRRDIALTLIPLWQQSPSSSATWKTGPNDPRERTKTWLDTYLDADHTWITKDDDSTAASWAVMFSNPPHYTLQMEFRGSAPVHGLFTIDMPNSEPVADAKGVTVGYGEHVPIHVVSMDSSGCSGEVLQWKMLAELRYVFENYMPGSQRTLETTRSEDRDLGSMKLYDRVYVLEYRRDTT